MSRNIKLTAASLLSCSLLILGGCSSERKGTTQVFTSGDQPTREADGERSVINMADASSGIRSLPSQGDVNILVVPVTIRGVDTYYRYLYPNVENIDEMLGWDNTDSWTLSFGGTTRTFNVSSWLDMLDAAFFGDSEDTGYESVSSFYYKSSYGKLNISGVVSPVYETDMTYAEMLELADSDSQGAKAVTDSIVEDVYYDFFVNNDLYDVDQFDADNDGVIDGIWLVYDAPSYDLVTTMDSDLMWAYTTWYGDGTYWPGEGDNDCISSYGWASKWFMIDGMYASEAYVDDAGYVLPDSHTYIHETGHVMGLNDYYDYYGMRSPTGSLIMMDHNVYDQDVYSKYLLGWVEPQKYWATDVEEEDVTITLKPFESSGDCVVLELPGNEGWVGEEYIILCYWTPTGLNETDATNPYYGASSSASHYSGLDEAGIMMFHVDSRFLQYSYDNGWNISGIADEKDLLSAEDNSITSAYSLAYSNDTGYYGNQEYEDDVQLEMIDASNQFRHMRVSGDWGGGPLQEACDNSFLFREGDVYDSRYLGEKGSFYASFHGESALPDGINDYDLRLGIRVTFGEQDEDGATITLSYEE